MRDNRFSTQRLVAIAQNTTTPPTGIAILIPGDSTPCFPTKANTKVETAVTIPALPSSINNITIRRRTGWAASFSDSAVANAAPTTPIGPENAPFLVQTGVESGRSSQYGYGHGYSQYDEQVSRYAPSFVRLGHSKIIGLDGNVNEGVHRLTHCGQLSLSQNPPVSSAARRSHPCTVCHLRRWPRPF